VSEDLFKINPTAEVSEVKRFALGNRLVTASFAPFRYAQAGGYLKADYPAYAHFAGELPWGSAGQIILDQEQKDVFWSDLRPEGEKLFLMDRRQDSFT